MKTKSGQMYDEIAYKLYGDSRRMVELINANRDKVEVVRFSAGVEIEEAEVRKAEVEKMPPWMKG